VFASRTSGYRSPGASSMSLPLVLAVLLLIGSTVPAGAEQTKIMLPTAS
jgi:hypothetical protein